MKRQIGTIEQMAESLAGVATERVVKEALRAWQKVKATDSQYKMKDREIEIYKRALEIMRENNGKTNRDSNN